MSESTQRRTKRILVGLAGILMVAGISQILLELFDIDTLPSTLFFLLAACAGFGALALHFWSRPPVRWIVLAIAVAVIIGIGILGIIGPSMSTATKLLYNQRRWQAQQITSYRYTLRRGCYCPVEVTKPARIEVRDGAPVSITYVDSGDAADAHFFTDGATVDNLFQLIEESNTSGAAYISVVYDPARGYPTSIGIKHSLQAFDDQISYEITDFEIIR